jgi:cobalt-zinc-cadmium efflux system membrane fusion protein
MTKLPSLSLALLACLFVSSCSKSNETAAAKTQPAAKAPSDPMAITPNPTLLKDLKVGEPATSDIGTSHTVAARVEVDETRVTRVGSPVLGRISSILVTEGQQVQKGQVLALLNSTGLSDAQLGFLKAISSKQLAQRAVDRAQQLLKADVIGSAELQRREAELAEATAELDAARDQLVLLGMTAESVEDLRRTRSINSVARVIAPMDGTVLDRKVTLGQMIQPSDTVFDIAELSHVWLVADVPESNSSLLSNGLPVEAHLAAFPERKLFGKLSFIGATLNPETRTVRARMDLPNPSGRYKPAMLASMIFKDKANKRMVVPLSAVVREGNTESLFVETSPGTFRLIPVLLGEELEGIRILLDGIKPGQRIVLDGAFHLNNERRRLAVGSSEGA